MSERRTYRLPCHFADDHWERACGKTDEVISRTKTHVIVSMDQQGYEDMLSDAEYYADKFGPECGPGMKASARAVVKLLMSGGKP